MFPYIDPSLYQSSTSRTWNGKPVGDPSTWRRSLYVFTKRSIRYPLFETFDQPDTFNSCARRNRSTIAPQALLLMNNAFVMLQAERFAERFAGTPAMRRSSKSPVPISLPWRVRQTTLSALRLSISLRDNPNGLTDFCQTLFNLSEFVYRP